MNWSWSECIKSPHARTSSGKGLPSHFWNRNIVRSILPGLRRKRTGLLLSGPKSSFEIKVNLAFHLEIKVPDSEGRVERHRIHVAWSPVWSFHSQWWTAMSSAGIGLLCFLKCTVNAAIYQEIIEHASFCWQALWRCWFNFPAGLGTCPHCQRYQKLALSRGRWETPDPTMQMTWRPLSKQPGLPLHLSSATGWLPPCHAKLMQ